jgi:hypothetical protein
MRLLALVKSFPVIQIKEIRPVVMAVLKNMSYIEDRQDFHISFHCCGSGIRYLFDPWIRDSGWVKVRIRDEQPVSYFIELRKPFFGVKILKFFDADPGWKKVGSWMFIPDPQHCFLSLFCQMMLRRFDFF